MADFAHLEEFLAKVAGKLTRNLVETYCADVGDSALTSLDAVSRLKSVLEQALEDCADEAAEPVDP